VDLPLGMSRKDLIALQRALGSNEIANVLEDPAIWKGIAQLVNYRNPLRTNIPRRAPASAGQSAAYVTRRTSGATPAAFISDTDTITEDTGTPAQVSFTYRTIATRMKVTRLAQMIGRSYVDVFSEEAMSKAADFRNYEEKYLIAGDSTVNAKEWKGINQLMPNAQVVKMTTTVSLTGKGGDSVTDAKLRETIDLAKGVSTVFQDGQGRPSSALLTSVGGGRELDTLIETKQRVVGDNLLDVAGGFRMKAYDGVPIFRTSTFGSQIFFNNAKPTQAELLGATGSTTVIYCLNFEELWFEELEPFNVVPLATTDSQFDQADMRQTAVPVLRDTLAISMLTGVKVG